MKPCNSYISRASIKLTRLFFPQAEICLASRLPFLQVLINQELLTPFSLCSLHVHPELSQMLKTFSTLYSFPSPNLDRVFPPRKKMQRKGPYLFPFWIFIPKPLLFPLPPSFFPPLALEIGPINLGNQLHKHFSQSTRWDALSTFAPLLHHQESIWIHGGLQGTQTKAQNGPTILPKIDLELMGPSHVGFGLQNHQN